MALSVGEHKISDPDGSSAITVEAWMEDGTLYVEENIRIALCVTNLSAVTNFDKIAILVP